MSENEKAPSRAVIHEEILPDEELAAVTGGAAGGAAAKAVCFDIEYSGRESRYDIQNFIKQELRRRGVPEAVIARVPMMNPEKSYMSYGGGGMRVEWMPGWEEPRFTKTHD